MPGLASAVASPDRLIQIATGGVASAHAVVHSLTDSSPRHIALLCEAQANRENKRAPIKQVAYPDTGAGKLKSPLLHNRLTPASPLDFCDGRRMAEYANMLAEAMEAKHKRATLLQLLTDDRYRGRVFAAELTCCTVMLALTSFLAGVVIDHGVNVRTVTIWTGWITLLAALWWMWAGLREEGPREEGPREDTDYPKSVAP